MIGEEIWAKDRGGWGRWVAAVLAAILLTSALVADGFEGTSIAALCASPFLLYIVIRSLMRVQPVRFRFGEHAISRLDSPVEIAYRDVEAIYADGLARATDTFPKRGTPIWVTHSAGKLLIPPVVTGNATSRQVYDYLLERCPQKPAAIPLELQSYHREQLDSFDEDSVRCFGSRTAPKQKIRGRGWRAAGIALVLSGLAGIALAILSEPLRGAAIGFGVLWLVFGLLIFLLGFAKTATEMATRTHGGGALIVSPLGLALKQGKMTGQLKWHEIRDIKDHKPAKVRITNGNAIEGTMLQLHGTSLLIADTFDSPRGEIQAVLRSHWQPMAGNRQP